MILYKYYIPILGTSFLGPLILSETVSQEMLAVAMIESPSKLQISIIHFEC